MMLPKTFGDEIPKWAVVCSCDGEPNPAIVAWIDDDRVATGHVYVQSNVAFTDRRHKDYSASTFTIQHRPCSLSVRLNQNDLPELLDALDVMCSSLGRIWIGVPSLADGRVAERRQAIPFDLLCRVNGRLPRRKTRPNTSFRKTDGDSV